jgi:hypothetical protein
MPKGYWPASEKFLKGIGKPLENAQIPATSQEERRHNFLAAIGKNVAISIPFLCRATFCSYLLKVERAVNNFLNAQRSFPIYSLSNHTTFSQTGATVPLSSRTSSHH